MLRLRLFASWSLLLVVAFSVLPKDALHGFVHRLLHVERLSLAEMGEAETPPTP